MRILFICPSQEPGACGVGDYTRRLAGACIKNGAVCAILALNEEVDRGPNAGSAILDDEVPCLRLPNSLSWQERIERAQAFAQEFSPDWVSLQYVPYAYDSRGLPFRLAKRLQQICGDRVRRHVFFHELWVSAPGIKMGVLSILQRLCIRLLRYQWAFHVVETSNRPYAESLKTLGISAMERPVFSNVPFVAARIADEDQRANHAPYRCVHFGKVNENFPIEDAVRCLSNFAHSVGAVEIRALGSLRGGEAIWERFASRLPKGVCASKSGLLEDGALSAELQAADFAIVSSPLSILGKSGAVAALRGHRVPFVVLKADLESERLESQRLLGSEGHLIEEGFSKFQNWREALPPQASVDAVGASADIFLSRLRLLQT